MAENHGYFSADPQTRWIVDPKGGDRKMEVLKKFLYTDPDDRPWEAPAGSVVDGASIPEPLWFIVGSPYTGDYRRASIVHDVATENPALPAKKRKAADRMYYHACLCGGCNKWQATVQYIGVRIGAWIPNVRLWTSLQKRAKTRTEIFQREAATASMIGAFYEIAAEVEPRLEKITIKDLEAIVDRHLSRRAKL